MHEQVSERSPQNREESGTANTPRRMYAHDEQDLEDHEVPRCIEDSGTGVFDDKSQLAKPLLNRLVLVKGPLFDFCSATITVVISFAVVINYLVISDRVKLKDVPFVTMHPEAIYALDHQRAFIFPNAELSSNFDSGNARSVTQNSPYEFEIKVGGEHGVKNPTRRWFFFRVSNVQQPVTLSFFVSNITLDNTLLKTGMVPVFKSESSGKVWSRLETTTRLRQIDADEMEIEFSYQYDPTNDGVISFAMAYPNGYSASQDFYKELVSTHSSNMKIILERESLTTTKEGNRLDVVFISSMKNLNAKDRVKMQGIMFPKLKKDKQIIVIMARTHAYESISSMVARQMIQYLLSPHKEAIELMKRYLFVFLPMINPDGVKLGMNIVDGSGNDFETVFPTATANNSAECLEVKGLISTLASTGKLRGFFNLRSTLDQNEIKLGIPSLSKQEIERFLEYPHFLGNEFVEFKPKSDIAVIPSPMLREIALITPNAFVLEINVPSMKKLPQTSSDITVSDIETVIVGDKASQGALGIRQISRKILNALLEMSQSGLNQTNISSTPEKPANQSLKPLVPQANSSNASTPSNSTPQTSGNNTSTSASPIQEDYDRRKAKEALLTRLEDLYKQILDLGTPTTPSSSTTDPPKPIRLTNDPKP